LNAEGGAAEPRSEAKSQEARPTAKAEARSLIAEGRARNEGEEIQVHNSRLKSISSKEDS
jgi:hypothetical protein